MNVQLNEFTAFLKDGVILPLELNKTVAGMFLLLFKARELAV